MVDFINAVTNIVTTQPTCDQPYQTDDVWKTQFLDAFSPAVDGIIHCICCCVCEGILQARTGEHFCTCLLPASTQSLRAKIRTAYGIKGSFLGDCVASSCCCCGCNLLQMKKELDHRNVTDPTAASQ